MSVSVHEIVFKDPQGVIQDWDSYCEMMDGVHACVEGFPMTENRPASWKLGFTQAYEHLERLCGMSEVM